MCLTLLPLVSMGWKKRQVFFNIIDFCQQFDKSCLVIRLEELNTHREKPFCVLKFEELDLLPLFNS